MQFYCSPIDREPIAETQLLVLPFWLGEEKEGATSFPFASLPPFLQEDFKAKKGAIFPLYPSSPEKYKRLALLGLGAKDQESCENYRQSFAPLISFCQQREIKELAIALPPSKLAKEELYQSLLEGLSLANYSFSLKGSNCKSDNSCAEAPSLVEKVTFYGADPDLFAAIAHKMTAIKEATDLARDLTNGNADLVTPSYLAEQAKKLAAHFSSIQLNILSRSELEQERLHLLLAVARGSIQEPYLITLSYRGDPTHESHTVCIGKGVTFDSGGLNLKPGDSMDTMRADMAGAAAALALMQAVAQLNLKINLSVVIPTVENSIDAKSYKPGDVYQSRSGLSVEIGNTDAEGRLILADAITYVKEALQPTQMIDLATLTGACVVALGDETAALFANDDKLAERLIGAGEETFERVWRLPLHPEYREQLQSFSADIKSTGGRKGGAITAALFLKEFVGDLPWAHLDIAGTAFLTEKKRYYSKGATAFGVRLLLRFLENLIEKGLH